MSRLDVRKSAEKYHHFKRYESQEISNLRPHQRIPLLDVQVGSSINTPLSFFCKKSHVKHKLKKINQQTTNYT
jgi:hypothetical protein